MMSTAQRVKRKQRVKKKRQRKRWDSFTDWARDQTRVILNPIVRILGQLGIHPNTVTIVGFLLQVGVGVLFSLGYVTLGGWSLMIVGPVDALDGMLARAIGQKSLFGAFLDSTLDRLSDAALILGLTAHYLRQGSHLEAALLLASLVATSVVSYVRARAEALGFPCKVGVLTRLERILLISVLSAVGLSNVMVWALAVLSVITMIQRILYVYAVSRRGEPGDLE
jgi:CDP-diacylglycerol--glycerol-3-phosphate 3-phosphatidyltransferase